VQCPPAALNRAGGLQQLRALPHQLGELGEHLGVRAQVGEHLDQAGFWLRGAVQRAVLPLGIIPALLPGAQLPRYERQWRQGSPEPPDALGGVQSPAPANARAVGTSSRRSSGAWAWRSTQAGASSSSRVLLPTNHALALASP
jgi:hypothetical protein